MSETMRADWAALKQRYDLAKEAWLASKPYTYREVPESIQMLLWDREIKEDESDD